MSYHGTLRGYRGNRSRKPCRCEPCTAAQRLHHSRYMAGHRTYKLVSPRKTEQARAHARFLVGYEPGRPERGARRRDPTYWSYQKLATHLGIGKDTLGKFVQGKTNKRLSARIANAILGTARPDAYMKIN